MDIKLDVALYQIRDRVLYIEETGLNDPYKPAKYRKVYNLRLYSVDDTIHIEGEEEHLDYYYDWDKADKVNNDLYETNPAITVKRKKYVFFGPEVEEKTIDPGWHCRKKRYKLNTILKDMSVVVSYKDGTRKVH